MNYLIEYQKSRGLTPDGIIGNNTVNAIHAFQRANGLGEGKMYNSDFITLCR